MKMHLPPMPYDCQSCGKSCAIFEVEIRPEDQERLLASPGYIPVQTLPGGRLYLQREPGGRCSYLSSESLCGIHQQLGYENKPQVCKDFPFRGWPTPDGIYIGLSFVCTSVVQGWGGSLERHRPELEQRFGVLDCSPDYRPLLWDETALSWEQYRELEERARQSLIAPIDFNLLKLTLSLARVAIRGEWAALDEPPHLYPDLGRLADQLVMALTLFLETAGQPAEVTGALMQALEDDQPFHSRLLKATIDPAGFSDHLPSWYPEQVGHYFDHVLFRKHLLEPPNLMARMGMLPLVTHLLRYYTLASAQVQSREPELADWHRALEILEGHLMFHARGADSFWQYVGRRWVESQG